MKTKILFVIDGLEFGGGERVFAQIITRLPQDSYESFMATVLNDNFQKAISKSSVHNFPVDFSNRYNMLNLFTLTKIIIRENIDIVHGQGARAEFYARIAAGLARRKCVSTLAMPVEGYDVNSFKKFLYRLLDRFSERFVDRFLVVSSVLEKIMVEEHGVPEEKVIKIYNGIETDDYNPELMKKQRRLTRQEFNIGNDEFLIGAVGRLVWQKGFIYFLQSIPGIIRIIPKAKFVLVGDGPLHDNLERLTQSMDVSSHLIFTGQRSDIREILAGMDMLIIPSLLEGFPMVTLEAMSMEKPIIATAIGGIMEQITDGIEGFLIPPGDPISLIKAVEFLFSNKEQAQCLGKAARQRVIKDFSVQTMMTKTMKIYDEI